MTTLEKWGITKNENDLENEDNLKNESNLRPLKNQDNLKTGFLFSFFLADCYLSLISEYIDCQKHQRSFRVPDILFSRDILTLLCSLWSGTCLLRYFGLFSVYSQLLQLGAVYKIRQVFQPVASQSSEKWVLQSVLFYLHIFWNTYRVFNFLAFMHRSSGTCTM